MNYRSLVIKKRKEIFRVLILLFLCTFPTGFKLNTILIYAIFLTFLFDNKLNLKLKIKKILNSKLFYLYCLYVFIQLLGFIHSDDLSRGIRILTLNIPTLILPAVIIGESSQINFYKVLKPVKVLLPLVFILMVLVYSISDVYDGLFRVTQIWFVDTIGISQFYLCFILLVPVCFCLNDYKENKLFNITVFIVCGLIILLLNNITSIVLYSLFVLLLFKKEVRYGLWLNIFLLMGLLTVMIYSSLEANEKFIEKYSALAQTTFDISQIQTKNKYAYTRNTFEHRIYIDYLIFQDLKNTFPFGVGTGDSQSYLNGLYHDNKFLFAFNEKLNAHNQYLQEYLKVGLIGVITLLMFFIIVLKDLYKNNSIAFYYVLSFAFANIVESYLNRYHGIIIFAAIIPMLFHTKFDNHFTQKTGEALR